ncbi:MAG: 2-oxo acid dehydrogenase subunit E2 [Gemmatimonadetes bacterium]|nr:2-oxo acid dehydrogenase subunit E2 [Gemmatimonadota bacterium]
MPQMGESIAEGTVSKWLKSVGETVQRDEPILEISTDKVDAEIPAPAAGTIVAIEVQEGQTVEVGTIVAYIDTEGGAPSGNWSAPAKQAAPAAAPAPSAETAPSAAAAPKTTPPPPATSPAEADEPVAPGEGLSADDRIRLRSTPVVRKIAEEHGVDITRVEGTGHAGRVTKQDILAFIEGGQGGAGTPAAAVPTAGPAPSAAPSDLWKTFYGQVQHPEFPVREGDRVEPMDKIRRLTAEHMVVAKRIAPHVHSFIEIDFTSIDKVRKDSKKKWEAQGARVSYTAFVVWAVSRMLREFPQVNGTISGNNIIFRGGVNIGIAVDLDPGLIVPVIRNADHLSLLGIGQKIADLAERARSRQLAPDEIQGATFTITNPGVLGTLVGMPIIPKGTAAILGTGAIEKRVVVVEDASGSDMMAIRKRSIFSLGYDHRLVDGADSARFLSRLRQVLEDFPTDA